MSSPKTLTSRGLCSGPSEVPETDTSPSGPRVDTVMSRGKSGRSDCFVSRALTPALVGDGLDVDVVDAALHLVGEHAAEHAEREDPRIEVGEAAAVADLDRVDGPPARPTSSRPSWAHRPRYGMSSSASSTSVSGTLTALLANSPRSTAATCSAIMSPARSRASTVDSSRWGARSTPSCVARAARRPADRRRTRWRPRPPPCRSAMARAHAAGSTTPAGARLMTRTPSFMRANSASPTSSPGSRVAGQVHQDEVGFGVEALGIVGGRQHVHAQGQSAPSPSSGATLSGPDDAERPAAHLDARPCPRVRLPAAGAQVGVRTRQVARRTPARAPAPAPPRRSRCSAECRPRRCRAWSPPRRRCRPRSARCDRPPGGRRRPAGCPP